MDSAADIAAATAFLTGCAKSETLSGMSAQEIIAELPKLSAKEREMILSTLVSLDMPFEPSPAMEEAIREGLRSVRDERTYSADELRSRIAEWTAR